MTPKAIYIYIQNENSRLGRGGFISLIFEGASGGGDVLLGLKLPVITLGNTGRGLFSGGWVFRLGRLQNKETKQKQVKYLQNNYGITKPMTSN